MALVDASVPGLGTPLGGSWLGLSRVISRITIVITYIKGLITPLITSHEPPSRLTPKPAPVSMALSCSQHAIHTPQ